MEFSIDQIAGMLGGEVKGDGSLKIRTLSQIEKAAEGSLSFLSNLKYENHIYTTEASAVIVSKDFSPKKKIQPTLIAVEDPYTSFTVLLEEYHKFLNYQKSGIEQPSYIGENSTYGDDVYRGAFSYIGSNVKIGCNVKIYPHSYIGDNVSVGDNTIIQTGVKIYAQSRIGNNCVIHAGTVIGSDGFGFAPQKDGTYKTIPQLGNVIIEDNVDIGANTVIDCATLESTIIRKGVKLDNLIQIAHNVEIGKNTVIAAQSGISGSAKIGENCIIAGQVGIVGHLTIADKTTVGAQAGVGKSIKESGAILLGSPGFDRAKYLRSYAAYRNLPELVKRIKELEEKILNLPTN